MSYSATGNIYESSYEISWAVTYKMQQKAAQSDRDHEFTLNIVSVIGIDPYLPLQCL